MWFAEKFVSLLIEQHRTRRVRKKETSCDLLKNSYLCLLNNTQHPYVSIFVTVVICWKIRIFAYWTTPKRLEVSIIVELWFAEKFVSLLIEQHLPSKFNQDLVVVICWKIRIFAYWTTPVEHDAPLPQCCDLLKNSYLCLLNNTSTCRISRSCMVVICWKIRIFAYWTTPWREGETRRWALWFAEKFVSLLIEQHQQHGCWKKRDLLWFAEKFVSLLIEQHPDINLRMSQNSCDLLKNSYLCLLNNTRFSGISAIILVVICWKIRIFAYWTTPITRTLVTSTRLWFAEKFVSLLIEQHQRRIWTACAHGCDLLKNSYLCLLNNTNQTHQADQV